MKDRIRQLMEQQHMTQQTFAEFLGISSSTLSSIFNERTRPTLALVEAIKQKIKTVNTDWLLFGTGDMFLSSMAGDGGSNGALSHTQQNASAQQPDLFAPSPAPNDAADGFPAMVRMEEIAPYGGRQQGSNYRPYKSQQPQSYGQQPTEPANQRQITEIRIFYSDQTWETFVPKK